MKNTDHPENEGLPPGPRTLPIEVLRADLLRHLRDHQRAVLRAPTGSGKSTQVPQMLLDGGLLEGGKQVIVLQPRRLAARMLAARVAQERQSTLGDEVGFHIRFEHRYSPRTRILFVTEGILLRMMMTDPLLGSVGAVILDEFHERHLHSEIALGLIKALQRERRPDLNLVVMSATLDGERLSQYLHPCPILQADGRTYPITIEYDAPTQGPRDRHPPPLWTLAARAVADLTQRFPEGDVLVFMPGAYEIRRSLEAIRVLPQARQWEVLPLYGELPPAEQDRAVQPSDRRKVVVATNVAETSLTIDGIRLVVDTGVARIASFDAHRGINTLLIEKISQASADQRAGRAGRTAPGVCCRLWSERDHQHRAAHTIPEIHRLDLSETVLTLKQLGVLDPATFPWFEPPPEAALTRAVRTLHDLGALSPASDQLSVLGTRMAAFPLHPRLARMLIAAGEMGCLPAICVITALTQVRRLLLPLSDPREDEAREAWLGDGNSDLLPLLRAWESARQENFDRSFCQRWGIHREAARQVQHLASQFSRLARDQGLEEATGTMPADQAIARCLLLGFSDQVAKRDNRATLRCSLVNGRRGELSRRSRAREASLLVASEVDEVQTGRGEVTVMLNGATAVEEDWLTELFPDDLKETVEAVWDPSQKRVVAQTIRRFRDLVLEVKESGTPPPEATARILTQAVLDQRVALRRWNDAVEAWIQRVNFAAHCLPDLGLPAIDQEGRELLIAQICHGATSARDLREVDPWPTLRAWLTDAQHDLLERACPPTMTLPSRRQSATIRYEPENRRAVISSRLQDFYDIPPAQLRIGLGQWPLTVELLAPNGRPCQITNDLAGFWENSYPEVKKTLKGRYPKHEWR